MKTLKRLLARQKTLWMISIVMVFSLTAANINYFEINKQLDIFTNVFKEINLYYVDEAEPSKLMDEAIISMLKSLDPYTNYIRESEVENFKIQTTGQYGGIGASIRQRNDYVMIVAPYKDFPADKAGLQAGDYLMEIDGKSLKNMATDEVSRLLKGSPGSTFELLIKRGESTFSRKITREEIQLKSVPYCGMVAPGIGFIQLSSFTDKASKEIIEAYNDLKKDNKLEGLILDLRNNPGGLLNEAVNVSNIFIDRGQEVVSTRGKIKEWERSYKTLNQPVDKEIPLVILINRSSASASEIVSGTIQDLDRGVLIGQRSFGKGLVQQTRKLSYGAQIKITVSKYYTPAGRCIQAINYAEKNEDGSVSKVPDSLRTAFTTIGGRTVLDGGGIDPDLLTEPKRYSNILLSLLNENILFDFATNYVNSTSELPEPGTFKLSNKDLEAFKSFAKSKAYNYETKTEAAINTLKENSLEEMYYTEIEKEIEKLKAKFISSKKDDMENFKEEIAQYLEQEIIARKYYQEGRIRQALNYDNEVSEAIKILTNKEVYQALLQTTTKTE